MSEIDDTVTELTKQIGRLQIDLANEKQTSSALKHELKAYNPSFELMEKRALAALTTAGLAHPFTVAKQTTILEAIDRLLADNIALAGSKRNAEQFSSMLAVLVSKSYEACETSGVHVTGGKSAVAMVVETLRALAAECVNLGKQYAAMEKKYLAARDAGTGLQQAQSQVFKLDAAIVKIKDELEYERKGWGVLSNALFDSEGHTLDDAIALVRELRSNVDDVYRANVDLVAHGLKHKINHVFNLANELQASVETLKKL